MSSDPAKPKLESYCSKAFNGISITPSGGCAPCCLFERTIQKDDSTQFKIWEDDISEIFNSGFMKDVRRKMLNGEKIEACRQCYQIENHGGYSLRQLSNDTESFPVTEAAQSDNFMPAFIDLKLNNKCNLKCRMCQPRDSHLIYSEFKKLGEKDPYFARFTNTHLDDADLGIPLSDVPDWSASPAFIDQFKKMLPHIRKVAIVGGEPLILNEMFDLLDLMIEKGVSKKIYIAFTTNLVHFPFDRLQKCLPFFERVLFNISLDAVDEELYYLRFPTSFEKVKANFNELLRLRMGTTGMDIQFSPTIQVYNILTVDKVYRFVEKLLQAGVPLTISPVNLTFLEFPVQLNIRILPEPIRREAIRKLEALKKDIPFLLRYKRVEANFMQLLQILREDPIAHHDYVPEFLYYSELLDRERGQSGKSFFPELFELLKNYKAKPPVESFHQIRERGWRLASSGKIQEAINEFESALKTSMNKDLDYREIAWMKKSLGDHESALEFYEKSLRLNPTNHYTLKGLAFQYALLGIHQKLKDILPDAIKYNPEDRELLDLARNLKEKIS